MYGHTIRIFLNTLQYSFTLLRSVRKMAPVNRNGLQGLRHEGTSGNLLRHCKETLNPTPVPHSIADHTHTRRLVLTLILIVTLTLILALAPSC